MFHKILQFLVQQCWSHTKLLEKVFMTYSTRIPSVVKKNLNQLLYIPTVQNDNNEINLV